MHLVISSGHGKHVGGASDILDEVTEARKVVDELANELRMRGVEVTTFHDNTSYDQDTNLKTIVNFHNSQTRDIDISVHFNAYEHTSNPRGTEVFSIGHDEIAGEISAAIAEAGDFIDRGAKDGSNLYFCNNTEMPALLLEICFVDSAVDADHYTMNFETICAAIADVFGDRDTIDDAPKPPGRPEAPPEEVAGGTVSTGRCSWFGGPDDDGVSPDEGLAFIYDIDDAPHLFLPDQPEGTTGLARRLNPYVHYFAMRFDYGEIPKDELINHVGLIRNPKTGFALEAFPADWGPHEATDRIVDVSQGLLHDLGLATDDEVEVTFPYKDA
jgi:N-acetylmuramoyl-L-alanine amidase